MRVLVLTALLVLAPVAAQAAGLADVAWMQGSWRVQQGDKVVTETWLAADGGVMPGIGRTVKPGRAFVEFMRIDEKDGQIGFTAIVGRQPPVTFPAKSVSADEVVFENLSHDFPQRVTYRRCGEDLCAATEGLLNGKLEREEWRYSRVK